MRYLKRHVVLRGFYDMLVGYPAPANLSYMWNFGSLAGLCLVIQLVTGVGLAMHYTPQVDSAFVSLEHIMRDVQWGWLLRYIHSNGASMFFVVVYLHILRGLYYGSYLYPREHLWGSGIVLFLLMIITAFMGYVLPWGQMSFWGATVITNLFSAIPIYGQSIVYWLWGGFSIDNATLNRFYSLHYLFPFIIIGLVLIHLVLLHENGSNNPLGVVFKVDKISFHPYFSLKDLLGVFVCWVMFAILVFYTPNMLGHPDNYIQANAMVTPPHIVPEWYFLVFYAILRSVPNKLGGVVLLLLSILVLLSLPYLLGKNEIRGVRFKQISQWFFWLFVANGLLLGWIGGNPAEEPYSTVGQVCTIFYFLLLGVIMPVLSLFDKPLRMELIELQILRSKPPKIKGRRRRKIMI